MPPLRWHICVVDKWKPTYDLESFKAAFNHPGKLAVTGTALRDARALGFDTEGIVEVIQLMLRSHFYKSTTSNWDHTEWQDVYHVTRSDMTLYVKFRADRITEFRLLSFKEKGS
ncbi:MAG: type II toxin-antitoxin system MqsR family toxin [Methylocella sp.]